MMRRQPLLSKSMPLEKPTREKAWEWITNHRKLSTPVFLYQRVKRPYFNQLTVFSLNLAA